MTIEELIELRDNVREEATTQISHVMVGFLSKRDTPVEDAMLAIQGGLQEALIICGCAVAGTAFGVPVNKRNELSKEFINKLRAAHREAILSRS